jgi:hypothetical protein
VLGGTLRPPDSLDTGYYILQPGRERGRLLGLRSRSQRDPRSRLEVCTYRLAGSALSPAAACLVVHLPLRYAFHVYVGPRRPCTCLLGTPPCQCITNLTLGVYIDYPAGWTHIVPQTAGETINELGCSYIPVLP